MSKDKVIYFRIKQEIDEIEKNWLNSYTLVILTEQGKLLEYKSSKKEWSKIKSPDASTDFCASSWMDIFFRKIFFIAKIQLGYYGADDLFAVCPVEHGKCVEVEQFPIALQ